MTTLESTLTLKKDSFEDKATAFLKGMPQEGPFVPGLKTKESNRRLDIFRKVFSQLVQDMDFLDVNYVKLRKIVDGTRFFGGDFFG